MTADGTGYDAMPTNRNVEMDGDVRTLQDALSALQTAALHEVRDGLKLQAQQLQRLVESQHKIELDFAAFRGQDLRQLLHDHDMRLRQLEESRAQLEKIVELETTVRKNSEKISDLEKKDTARKGVHTFFQSIAQLWPLIAFIFAIAGFWLGRR